jgi:hypothetical protein
MYCEEFAENCVHECPENRENLPYCSCVDTHYAATEMVNGANYIGECMPCDYKCDTCNPPIYGDYSNP